MSATKTGDAGKAIKYPGVREALDGSYAVVAMETAGSEAAGAYPITPSTQMGEGWAQAVAEGKENVNGRRLLFFEPEGEHAAAAVTAGMSMAGLRSTNFSSGQGIAYMHESLYAAVGKRLTYVLNVAARAITKHALNVHAGHDDYHAVDDTGFFQLFAKDVQEGADLNLVAHRIAELSLNPGIIAQDGFLTSHVIESVVLPERELIKEYLGDPSDMIDSPTPAQRLVFGAKRRRIPEMFDFDYPAMLGVVQNQDSYAQGVAAQRPFYFDHIADLTDQAQVDGLRDHLAQDGPIHALINNAGGAFGVDSVEKSDPDDWARMFDVNVIAVQRVVAAMLPLLRDGAREVGHADILMLGSIAGQTPYEGGGGYNASKFALHAMTGVLRLELNGEPIRVIEVAPGMVKTDEFSLNRLGGDRERADAVYAGVDNPLTAEDIAEVIVLAIELPGHVNLDLVTVKPVAQAAPHKVARVPLVPRDRTAP